MLTRSLCAVSVMLLFLAAVVSAQGTPAGHWEGSITANGQVIGLSLDLARNANSEWIASMGVPSENLTGLVVLGTAVTDTTVTFVAVELQMAKVNLTIGPDGTLKGTMSTPEGPTPVEFKRTGVAKVELMPPSPAVSRELEGDWEGSLETPGGPIRMVIHFENRPDGTVAATFDPPDSQAMRLPLNDVKQTGREVEFGIRVAHASFRGTLNEDSSEIAGQFGHEGNRAPLTLRKR